MPIETSTRVSVRIRDFGVNSLLLSHLSVCRSVVTVVRYYMKYAGLSFGPSPRISFLDVLLSVRGAGRVERQQNLWVLVRF